MVKLNEKEVQTVWSVLQDQRLLTNRETLILSLSTSINDRCMKYNKAVRGK